MTSHQGEDTFQALCKPTVQKCWDVMRRSCCRRALNMKKHMTADKTKSDHTESSADTGLQSLHCLSGINSTIVHLIETDITQTRRAVWAACQPPEDLVERLAIEGTAKSTTTLLLIHNLQYTENIFQVLFYNRCLRLCQMKWIRHLACL